MRTQQIEEKAAVGRSKQLGARSEFAKNLSPGDTAPRTAMRLFPLSAPSSIPTQHACGRHQEESWSILTSETGAPQTTNSKAGSPHATWTHPTATASQTESGVFHTQPQHGQRALQTTSPPHTQLPHLPALPSDRQGHTATALLVHGQGERQPRGTALVCRKDVPAPHTSLGTWLS